MSIPASKMRRSANFQHCFGVRDGLLDAFLCLLGPEAAERADGTFPIERDYYAGELSDDLRMWIEERVEAILDQKAEESEGMAGSFYESLVEAGIR